MTRQFVLDLGHRPAYGREDFLVAPGNHEAVDWIDRWPAWPGHVSALFGPAGCGKSHLAQVFALRAQAKVLTPVDITQEAVGALLAPGGAVVVEQGEAIHDEQALLHLFNGLREAAGYLLLISQEPPARWSVALPDLKSRLSSVPAVRIAPPDDAMMEAVLVKLFADRQLNVAPEVIAYAVTHMDRSFASARTLVDRADAMALAEKRAITVPLVKTLLS